MFTTLVRTLSRKGTKSKPKTCETETPQIQSDVPVPQIIVPPVSMESEEKKDGAVTRLIRSLTKRNTKRNNNKNAGADDSMSKDSKETLTSHNHGKTDPSKSTPSEPKSNGIVSSLARSLSRRGDLSRSKSAPSRRPINPICDEVVNAELAQGPFFYDPLPLKPVNSEQMANLRAYRITESQLHSFRNILDMFRGTHNFHNYIPNATSPDDPKCYIRILTSTCSDAVLSQGMQWITVTLSAKGFAQSQIRKMISLAVLVTRTNTPRSLVGNSFGLQNIDIPEFPSWGLVCSELSFESYTRARGVQLKSDQIASSVEGFKASRIVEFVHRMERESMT